MSTTPVGSFKEYYAQRSDAIKNSSQKTPLAERLRDNFQKLAEGPKDIKSLHFDLEGKISFQSGPAKSDKEARQNIKNLKILAQFTKKFSEHQRLEESEASAIVADIGKTVNALQALPNSKNYKAIIKDLNDASRYLHGKATVTPSTKVSKTYASLDKAAVYFLEKKKPEALEEHRLMTQYKKLEKVGFVVFGVGGFGLASGFVAFVFPPAIIITAAAAVTAIIGGTLFFASAAKVRQHSGDYEELSTTIRKVEQLRKDLETVDFQEYLQKHGKPIADNPIKDEAWMLGVLPYHEWYSAQHSG